MVKEKSSKVQEIRRNRMVKTMGYWVRTTYRGGNVQNRGIGLAVKAKPYPTKAEADKEAKEMRRIIRNKGYTGYRVSVVQAIQKK